MIDAQLTLIKRRTCGDSHWKIFQWVSLVEERRIAAVRRRTPTRERVSTPIRRTRLLPLVFHWILVQRMPRYADFRSAELLVNAVQFGLHPPLDGEAMEMLRPTLYSIPLAELRKRTACGEIPVDDLGGRLVSPGKADFENAWQEAVLV